MTAAVTYSPEDNKIRLYVGRVPRDEYERLREAGFVSTPKQNCDFVATWTPDREDLAREYLDEDEDIADEDYSPTERAADRAERFEGYREKRLDEATSAADRFEAAPAVIGHQSADRANRIARRANATRRLAASQWSKAEYWRERTAGVIAHALHRADPKVRRGRILTLEKEQRKHQGSRDEYATRYAGWQKVLTMPGADSAPVQSDRNDMIGIDLKQSSPAAVIAYRLANGNCWGDYTHPRTGRKASLWSLLTDSTDPITAAEAAQLWLAGKPTPDDPTSYAARWSDHYARRLEYENAMLENEGGKAADVEMIPGGFLGQHQIVAVHKSPVTKRVVSVDIIGPHRWKTDPDGSPVIGPRNINIERLGENVYRAPTDEELAAFKQQTADAKAAAKATKPAPLKLINPTDKDAQRLQDQWNAAAAQRSPNSPPPPAEIVRMTQAEYSERSKGTYARFETHTLDEHGLPADRRSRREVLKVRVGSATEYGGARRVVILTDKSQSPIPWEAIAAALAGCPTVESLADRIGEIEAAYNSYRPTAEQWSLIADAVYCRLVRDTRYDTPGFTELGRKMLVEFHAKQRAAAAEASQPADGPAPKPAAVRELMLF